MLSVFECHHVCDPVVCVGTMTLNRKGMERVLWLRLQMNQTATTVYVSCNEYLLRKSE